MKDFNFKIPQNIQFGMGSLKKLPEILAENHSDNILLVSDRGLEKIGVVKKVQDIIEAAGLKCTSYLDVVPNPTVAVVNEATALYKECGATSIVALGGGSSMDVGKAVGVLVNSWRQDHRLRGQPQGARPHRAHDRHSHHGRYRQ